MATDQEDIIIITQGEKAEFDIFLEKASGFPRPIDLTNYDLFKLCVEGQSATITLTETPNVNGSYIDKVSPDVLGQLHIVMAPEDSAALVSGFGQDLGLTWDNSGSPAPKKKILHKALNVEEALC